MSKRFPRRFLGQILLLAAIMAALTHSALSEQPPAGDAEARRKKLWNLFRNSTHLTQAKVLKLLGKPERKARQIVHRRYLEQWQYGPPLDVEVTFAGFPGKAPRVISVRLPGKRKP